MSKLKSEILRELEWRGLLYQSTNLPKLDEVLASKKITCYIGFDCTATSLHIGSLLQLMIIRLFQKFGHRVIILLGGGTTKLGDPSGKDQARQILDKVTIAKNMNGIRSNIMKFVNLEDALIVDNDEWLSKLKYVDFLREIGSHFSVNRMINFDSVKIRLERESNLSFLEFNYMILQAFDFVSLYKNYDCVLQIGGSDQWGNIVNGVDLARKLEFAGEISKLPDGELFGLTTPLVTTSSGKKMGKTENGAIWLDENLTNPFEYFQYFRNIDDADIEKFLRYFTELSRDEIEGVIATGHNKAKEVLAFEAIKICHGREVAEKMLKKANDIFQNKNLDALDVFECKMESDMPLFVVMRDSGICETGAEAKRLIKSGAVKIDDDKITDEKFLISSTRPNFKLSVGKKRMILVKIVS